MEIMSPSPLVAEWAARLARRTTNDERQPAALDVAMGRGRHAVVLARAGFKTFGVDIRRDAVSDAVRTASAGGLSVHGWCADLTQTPLPRARFDAIVVTRYLQRDLFPALREALVPGGAIVFETFTVAQRALGRGPTSPDHLLELGELRERFEGLEVLFYEEVSAPEAVARIVARRFLNR
jgi:SAM-dependent methyltransferase